MFFFEIEQIFSIPVDQIPYSAYKQAWPVRVPILPLQNPHTFFFVFYYSVIPVALEFFKIFRSQGKEISIRPTKFFLLDALGNARHLNILYHLCRYKICPINQFLFLL